MDGAADTSWDSAVANADVSRVGPGSGLGRQLRRVVARLGRSFLRTQAQFNRDTLGLIVEVRNDLAAQIAGLARNQNAMTPDGSIERRTEELEQRIHGVSGRVQEQLEKLAGEVEQHYWAVEAMLPVVRELELNRNDEVKQIEQQAFARFHEAMSLIHSELSDVTQLVEERFDDFESRRSGLEQDLAEARFRLTQIDLLLNAVRRTLPEVPTATVLSGLPSPLSLLYVGLEEAFRGSRATIHVRASEYLDEVLVKSSERLLLDIGSGRGEWLAQLGDAGVAAYGVEINPVYVEEAKTAGLDVRLEFAIDHLRTLEEGSLRGISAFHIVEHLETDDLLELLSEALRVIEPGGLLIIETPNPENLIVGACTFYFDPTHVRPIPAKLLEFFVGSRGFGDVRIDYKHPATSGMMPMPSPDNPWYAELAPVVDMMNVRLFGDQDYSIVARRL